MRRFFQFIAIGHIVASVAIACLFIWHGEIASDGLNSFVKNYFDLARVPLFSGFLTLGSFMLTLQTTILQRLKEAYDTPEYMRKYLAHREDHPEANYYESLDRLSLALSFGIISAFVTALLQMTLGFVKVAWASAICISAAGVTLFLVGYLTFQILASHREWFGKIEKQKQDEIKALPKAGSV